MGVVAGTVDKVAHKGEVCQPQNKKILDFLLKVLGTRYYVLFEKFAAPFGDGVHPGVLGKEGAEVK